MAPNDDEIVQILRCLIHARPGGNYAQATRLAQYVWRRFNFARLWPRATPDTLINVITGKQGVPTGGYEALHDALAIVAAAMLSLGEEQAPALLAQIRRERNDLTACLDDCFDFAARSLVAYEPTIYSPLDEAPYWEAPTAKTTTEPLAKEKANTVFCELRNNDGKRIVYVHGPPFSAKREILKAVVRRLEAKCLVRHDNTRLPALAIAAESVSVNLFVDRVFKFFASRMPAAAANELIKDLNMDNKLAFIRAAAQTAPILLIVADVESFDTDATIRRLRGDRIGDVIQTVLDANKDTRLLIGLLSDPDLPWEADAISVPVHAVQDELIDAINGLAPALARKYQRILTPGDADPRAATSLDSLVMRLIIAVFERSKGSDRLTVAEGSFDAALKINAPNAMFDCLWRDMTTKADRLRLGLIATSHDGLRTSTFKRLLMAMGAMSVNADTAEALTEIDQTPDALIEWARKFGCVVRLRDDGGPDETSFYFRDAIRRQVLRAWMRDHPDQCRDAFWCLARETADQADRHVLNEGAEEPDYPLARNLQALKSLLASIDPRAVHEQPGASDPLKNSLSASNILPTLDIPAKVRPDACLAYMFAWRTLYKMELEKGEIDADGRLRAPTTRLSALLSFLSPTTPWTEAQGTDLSLASKSFADAMGLAAVVLNPAEQLDLLTRLAISAYRARRFTLVLVAIQLVEELERRHKQLPVSAIVRVYRLRLALGFFYCGDPVLKDPSLWPDVPSGEAEEDDFKLGWAVKVGRRLLALLPRDNNPDSIISRGKLYMRIAAIESWRGHGGAAGLAFVSAYREERELTNQGYGPEPFPISLGKSARSVVRHLFWRAARTTSATIDFADGLKWPTLAPVTDEGTIALARTLLDGDRRQARRGKPGARLHVKLDEARLAMNLGAFDRSEADMSDAVRIANRGAAFEALFELAELRIAIASEVGMRRLAIDQSAASSIEIRNKMTTALDGLRKIQRLGPLPLIDALLRYHEAQALLLESRALAPHSPKSLQIMVDARRAFVEALDMMNEAGIGIYTRRITQTISALDSMPKETPAP
jgi:hypothetical protein